MSLGNGKPQFTIITRVDGQLVKEQPIHDPFLHNKTEIYVSRWDLFKALFRRQYKTTVEVSVRATEGAVRKIMMLDPKEIERETAEILAHRSVPAGTPGFIGQNWVGERRSQ